VEVGGTYLTPTKDLVKEKTKTEKFENPSTENISQTARVVRKSERFTSQKSGLASKLPSNIEPVL
jgi:hypothetical protein